MRSDKRVGGGREKLIKRAAAALQAKSFSTPSAGWHKNALAAHEWQTNTHTRTHTHPVQRQINNKKSSSCRQTGLGQ